MLKLINQKLLVLALLLLWSLNATSALGQKRGPSTLQERNRAVEIANILENDPLNKKAKDLSRELLVWLVEVPDITVTICTGMLGDYSKIKGDYAGTITTQLSFGEVRFVIEHPEEAKDEYQVYLAGVQSVLRTYQNIKKAKPRVSIEPLEELLVKQQEGQLPDFVKAALPGCK